MDVNAAEGTDVVDAVRTGREAVRVARAGGCGVQLAASSKKASRNVYGIWDFIVTFVEEINQNEYTPHKVKGKSECCRAGFISLGATGRHESNIPIFRCLIC